MRHPLYCAWALIVSTFLLACAWRPPPPRTLYSATTHSPVPSTPVAPASITTPLYLFRLNPHRSQVIYRAREKWLKEDVLQIVLGRTQEISGRIWLDLDQPSKSRLEPIAVNLDALHSDDVERDAKVRQEYLDTPRYPLAIFTTTALVGLPERYQPGDTIRFEAIGTLLVRGINRPQMFEITTQLSDDAKLLRGTASTQFPMSDFDIVPPSKVGVTVVDDELRVEFEFVAERE